MLIGTSIFNELVVAKIKKQAGTWFGEKVELDGYTFDSKKEAIWYARFVKPSGYEFKVHPKFELIPKIEVVHGLNLRSITYKPDFVIYNEDGSIKHVYDLKNSFTTYAIDIAASLRFKLFGWRYKLPVEVVVPRAKSFRVKVMGTTKKFEPIEKTNFDYTVDELVEEALR